MEYHPQPTAGEARPWAFPAPDRGALPNGLTVLRCHRPGQQVVAVEIFLDAPLDAEPEGLDGVATIMARALSEGTDKHSAEEFAAELERCGATLDAHADHPGVRVSLEVPVSRLSKALGLVAEALRAPAFTESEVERLVGNRLDEIPHEQANPARRAAKQLSKELFPATARMSRPRQGTEETVRRIDAAGVRAFYDAHVRPSTATAVIVGDLTGVDLDTLLADTIGDWSGNAGQSRPVPPITADDTGRVVIVDRPGAVQTQLLIGRIGADRHDSVWPAQVLGTYCLGAPSPPGWTASCARRRATPTVSGPSARCCARRHPDPCPGRPAPRCSPSAAPWTRSPPSTALDDLWKVLRTLAAEGLTDAERETAVQNLVGVAPLKFETAASVAGTLADQVEQHLPDDYQAQLYARLAETGTVEATAAVVNAFPVDRLVTVLVGDASQIAEPVRALGIGEVSVVTG